MSKVGPFREYDDQGRQLVQVRFPGANIRSYGYAVPKEIGTVAVGDLVWTEGNAYNPFGSPAAVKKIGSDFAGKFAEITCRLSPGYEPQTITVKRYRSAASVTADRLRNEDRESNG